MSEIEKSELLDRFTYLSERESSDHLAVNCPSEQLIEFCTVLRDEYQFDMLLDVTAIDWDVATPDLPESIICIPPLSRHTLESHRIVRIILSQPYLV